VPQLVKDFRDPAKRNKMTAAQITWVENWLAYRSHQGHLQERKRVGPGVCRAEDLRRGGEREVQRPGDCRQQGLRRDGQGTRTQFRKAFPDRYKALAAIYDFKEEYGNRNPVWAKYYGFPPIAAARLVADYPRLGVR